MPMPIITVISDVICPWCFIGKRQLERALTVLAGQELGFAVAWHPYQLNPDMPVEGVERAAYRAAKFGSPERGREIDARLARAGEAVGIDFNFSAMRRTPNTVAAHRVIRAAGAEGRQNEVVERLFAAYFLEGRDIGDPDVLAACDAAAGGDAAATRALLASDAHRAEVLAEDHAARRAGISGVPSFVLANHVLFSGALPAETMAEAFAEAWKVLGRDAA
ncbi:MAG: DsbA family oxidoreductase [Rhodospirillales bacterium]|nr:DsbA family oxidoreductase [Rhodospirillales bacterium]